MGAAGPVPKRSDQRRRSNGPTHPTLHGEAWPAEPEKMIPEDYDLWEADENWHPIAKKFYEDALRSGQCYYYEASDYSVLYMVCESISRDMKPQVVGIDPETGEIKRARIPLKGTSLNAYMKAMNDLLITEAGRRRVHVELVRGYENDQNDAKARGIASINARLGLVG